jgi:non-specific serine/threonine protein kinase
MAEPPDEGAVRALLDALLGALEVYHRTGGFHGKVTPSNILLLADNRPLLLSPDAAGRAIAGDRIDALMTSEEPSFAPVEQILESPDAPLHPSVDLYALAGVARYWISGKLPGPAFGTRDTAPREPLVAIVQRLRPTWPRLHYSASLLDTLESALSIYPAERPQTVSQMRARLGAAPPLAGTGLVSSSSSAVIGLNDAAPSSPERPPRPAQDLDGLMAFMPNRDPLESDGVVRIDVDPSARTDFARQAQKARRVTMWSAVVVLLLALMPVGLYEFHQEVPAPDNRGVNGGIGVEDSAAASAPSRTAPVTPPVPADVESAKSSSTVDSVAESSASAAESTSLASAKPADAGTAAEPTAVAQPPASGPAPSRVAQQNASRAPASPRAACGSRTRFSLYRCMQMQCSQRQWTSHPQCEHLRATDSVD